MNHEVKILAKTPLNHNVIQFRLERPLNYQFSAGQAIELTLMNPVAKGPAPFTFTGLNSKPDLELTIKIYNDHHGLTESLANLSIGEKVLITDPWDSFTNKGPGIFIAGGAGITPFIALLRQMKVDSAVGDSQLFFSNKTPQDVFLHNELKNILGDRYVDIITRDENGQRIDEEFIQKSVKDLSQPFYVCGPPGFVDLIRDLLKKVGASEQMINVSL
jgi:propane monooxygenase reductase component